jgi:energy-coupling factor transporter ATP-binding protein EcfA2
VNKLERQAAALRAVGRIEGFKAELGRLTSALEAVPLWLPAAGLVRQCAEVIPMIDAITARFDRRLVVTIIGPSGSGKSTLVNALAGGVELSETGHRRPTTGRLMVFGSGAEEAEELTRELGAEVVAVRPAAGGRLPEGVCLIDTPDTDSMANHRHLTALGAAVAHSDVLICVFDAENPKRRDHADYLAPIVRRFDGESLMAVLNKCDRLDETELKERILPDFLEYIRASWGGAVDCALCASARRHVKEPGWDQEAGPRHSFDQFDDLHRLVFSHMTRGGFVIDRRVENARRLHAFVLDEARQELASDREALASADRQLTEAETEAMAAAVAAVRGGDEQILPGMGLSVYQSLSQRWVGPVGWMLSAWTRLMAFGGGVASIFRFGRPRDRGQRAVSDRRRSTGEKGGRSEALAPERLHEVLRGYRMELLRRWPDAVEMLVRGRFDSSVRDGGATAASVERFAERFSSLWADAVNAEIDRIPRRLSGFWLQALLNAPVAGLLGYAGWITIVNFFSGSYLSGDFFLHALWAIVIALLLSFCLLQAIIRVSLNSRRIAGRAFDRLKRDLHPLEGLAQTPLRVQLQAVLRMTDAQPD